MQKKMKLIKLSLVLITSGLFIIGCGDTNDDKKDTGNGGNSAPKNPMSIYPKNPVVAKDGNLKLLPVISEDGKILEDSDEHTLYVTYKVKNEDIFTVGTQGDVTGINPGESEVTITIKDANTSKTYTNKVKIKVAVVDVSKLFLNPSVASLKKDERKEFTLTALDSESSATLIEGKYMKFKYQKDQIGLTSRITSEISTINITAKQQKGYTFVTPVFEKAGVRVTGDSTLIQFTSTPQSNAPSGASGGENIDFMRVKNGSGDDLYVVHTGEDLLYFESFKHKQGKWSRQKLDVDGTTVEYPKIYKDSDGIHVIVVSDNVFYKFTSENNGGSWTKEKLFDEKFSISSENNLDIIAIGSKIIFAFATDDKLYVYNISNNSSEKLFEISNIDDIKSLKLTSNKNGKLRMVFADKEGLTYVSEQNGSYYMKKIVENSGIEQVKIAYNKYNSPTIMYYKDDTLKEIEKTKSGWATASISSLQFIENGLASDALEDIRDFDFLVDRYGNSRIIVADDDKLYYIKEHGDSNSKDWRVDKIIEKDVGDYVSVKIDNKSRLKAIFQNTKTEWIKYWAEPVYVKYRDKSTKSKIDDELDINSNEVTKIVTIHSDSQRIKETSQETELPTPEKKHHTVDK